MCCRSRAWFNTLRAAYPARRIQWRRIPVRNRGRGGEQRAARPRRRRREDLPRQAQRPELDAIRRSPRRSSSSRSSTSPVGSFVMLFALTQGVLPSLPSLPNIGGLRPLVLGRPPALRAVHDHVPDRRLAGALRGAVDSRSRVLAAGRQGVVILTDFRRYLRQVAALAGRQPGCCASSRSTSSSRRSTSAARCRTRCW